MLKGQLTSAVPFGCFFSNSVVNNQNYSSLSDSALVLPSEQDLRQTAVSCAVYPLYQPCRLAEVQARS